MPRQRSAHASPPGQTGKITFRRGYQVFIAEPDGSGERVLVQAAGPGAGSWAPDGSRFVYAGGGPVSVRPDGTDVLLFGYRGSTGSIDRPVYAYNGRYVIYSWFGKLSITPADGTGTTGLQLFSVPEIKDGTDSYPASASDGTIIFQHGSSADDSSSKIYRIDAFDKVTKLIDSAMSPDFAPDDSKIAFVRLQAPDGWQIWLADADGSNQKQLTTVASTGSNNNRDPSWSPDGDFILFTSDPYGSPSVKRVDVTTGNVTTVVTNGSEPTCQPLNPNYVERVWGQTALGTAVATSRYNFADKGVSDGLRVQAQAVVLSRDDMYFDALGGSALAVNKQAPLLITPPGSLHGQTEAEIQRILAPGGTVYLLGGTIALSVNVENRLKTLGYTTVRLWGQSGYDTAIAVAKAITPNPTGVIIATSLEYYDALAAGAAAGANPGTVIVLTAGDTMPAATAAYLNSLDPDPDTGTAMIGVGGPGVRALLNAYDAGQMPNWPDRISYYPVYGATAFETAIAVAEFFFTGPRTAAVATATTWYDALTGGAMIGGNLGPLLLSAPGSLSPQTRDYLSRNSSTIKYGVLLGGPLALNSSLITPVGDAISVPGYHKYVDYTETFTVPPSTARSLAGTSAKRGLTTGGNKAIPGVQQRRSSTVER
ncbi:cell wall-binding repeat-containing protein [Dactylosporangium sp. NBC_01737]|uniref:cell wall-binding repeat-containing protein n=1 Tax=Dactylosporangium sp. NBC_01737 TaxID=2975959 RepID=UPI002E0DB4B7|nr:cell wall-binding repeat-containing protein [Dactylosporangium sp. NBC_01737]